MKRKARIAGILYMASAFPMAFTELFVRSKLIVWGNANETTQNIINSQSIYNLGFICDVIGASLFAFVPLALYRLLKDVNKEYAMLMVILALISVPMMTLNMVNHATVLELLKGAHYSNAFEPEQLNALVMVSIDAHGTGYLIAQIFFGLWLFPLGCLVYKSGFIPKFLGVLLMSASVCYLIQFITIFLFPRFGWIVHPIVNAMVGFGELGIIFWLILVGVKSKHKNK